MPNRIIKESVRESYSIDQLSADAERTFYRLLTYADDFGLFKADPRLVNRALFPLKDLDDSEVSGWLDEIAGSGMILFYVGSDGRPYGAFTAWQEHNRTRNNKPKHPKPPENNDDFIKDICTLLTVSAGNCKQVKTIASKCRSNPIQSNPIHSESNRTMPPSGGDHFQKKVGDHFDEIKTSCDLISTLPQNGKPFNPFQFVQRNVNAKKHPGAIAYVLKGMINNWPGIKDKWAYANKAIISTSQNFNEKEAVRIHHEMKKWQPEQFEELTKGVLKDV